MSFDYHIVRNARDAINFVDEERRKQGLSQMVITERADFPDVGQTYARFYGSGDGRTSRYIKMVDAIGWNIIAIPTESLPLFIACMESIKTALNSEEGLNGEKQGV